ncbi:MAG: DUF2071 domain-containing protein [Nitrosopumilus sp.]|nr:DUF2071 domain-containing protein [Nitrosopumilus sp.]
MTKIFLQAEWRKLAMANYEVDSKLLASYLPFKTEFDLWNNTCYVSLVGFMFLNTTVKGFIIPFHSDFEEVNLRFYVRYKDKDKWKRGVVFIKEIVPKHALTFIANTVYGENYETLSMNHTWLKEKDKQVVEYKWNKNNNWHSIKVIAGLELHQINESSVEEFITEHYWGYTKISEIKTSEYGVEHPKWQVYKTIDFKIDVNFEGIYGHAFSFLDNQSPKSVFLAEGSLIEVKHGKTI